jgi:uncharacterized membrane protein YkgB
MRDVTKTLGPSPRLLRLALGVVFFHFGFLKFFPDLSPAELIASQTIMRIWGGGMDAHAALWWLAVLECVIGLGFLFNVGLRFVSLLFLLHMIGTFMPLFVLPELAFKIAPLAPTLEGQYILKNIVFVAAGWTVLLPHCLGERPRLSWPITRLWPSQPAST